MRFLRQQFAKRICAVLALLAVSAALAQPVCGPDQPDTVHHEDCRVSLMNGTLAGPAADLAPVGKVPAVLPPAAASPGGRHALPTHVVRIPADRPPASLSYHARSARILI